MKTTPFDQVISREMAIPIYASHIKVALRWSRLGRRRQREILRALQVIKKESLAHVKALKELRKQHVQKK